MGCYRISDKARKLRKQYFEKYGEMPRGMHYMEGETMKKYEAYLEKEIRTREASTIFTKPQKVRN